MLANLTRSDVHGHFMGNAHRAGDVERCTSRPCIANCAIDTRAGELNCSGLKNTLAWCCTSVFHFGGLGQKG
jgi:hypothetical protein